MKLKNKLEVEETLEVGVLPNAPTTNFSVVFETAGLFQRRQVGSIINKNDNEYLPSVSNSFPSSVFIVNASTTHANPNLTVSFANQVAGSVFAAPQSLNGTPAFRMLQDSDLSQTTVAFQNDIPTSSDYITTNTNQTGLTGDKTTSGIWTFTDSYIHINKEAGRTVYGLVGSSSGDVHIGSSGIASPANGTQDYGFYLAHNAYRDTDGNWKHSRTSSTRSYIFKGGHHQHGFSWGYSPNVGTGNIDWTELMNLSVSGNGGTLNIIGNVATPFRIERTQNNNTNIEYINSGISIFAGSTNGNAFAIGEAADLNSIPNRWMWVDNTGRITSQNGFAINGQTDSSILLAGGGHRPVSDFALAASLGNYVLKSGDNISGTLNFLTQDAIHYAGVGRIFMTSQYTAIGGNYTGTGLAGVMLRPQGSQITTNQVVIRGNGQIDTTNGHGDSSQWNQAYGWGNHALAGYALSSQLSGYVPTTRTLTINGTTLDLSANRTWNIPDNDTITRLRGTTGGTFTSGDLTLLAGAGIDITQSGSNLTITNTAPNITQVLGLSNNVLSLSGGGGNVNLDYVPTDYNNAVNAIVYSNSFASLPQGSFVASLSTTAIGFPTGANGGLISFGNSAANITTRVFGSRNNIDGLWYSNGNPTIADIYQVASREWVNSQNFSTQTLTAGANIQITGNVISATDTNTTYTAGTGLSLTGTVFGQTITTSGTGTFVTGVTQTTNGFQVNLGTPPNTTYSAGSGLTLSGTTFSLPITYSGTGNYVSAITQTTNGLTVTRDTLPTVNNGTFQVQGVGSLTGNGSTSANASANTSANLDLTTAEKNRIQQGVDAYTVIPALIDGVDYHHLNTGGHVPIEKKKTIVNIPAGSLGYTINIDDALYDGYELAINGCGEWSVTVNGSIMDKCGDTDSITLGWDQGGSALFWWSVDLGMWIQAV